VSSEFVGHHKGLDNHYAVADLESFLRGCGTVRSFFRAGTECDNIHFEEGCGRSSPGSAPAIMQHHLIPSVLKLRYVKI
jgi:hypothetical protein